MPTNDFLPFAIDPAANVITQGAWGALPARTNGFVAGLAQSIQLNKVWRQSSVISAMLGDFIGTYGALDALDDGNVANLRINFARAIRDNAIAYVVATGTANAWVLSPTPTLAAYAAGRPLWVTAPATNTNTTVNANISGIGNRRIKKADGTDPAVGDLVIGRTYQTIDDGTNIRVLSTLPSEVTSTVAATIPIGGNWIWSQSIANNVMTTLGGSAYTVDGTNNLGDATFSGGVFTVGPQTAGLWIFIFSGVVTSATTDLVINNIHNNSSAIGYGTSQTSNSAPGIGAVTVKRLPNADNMRFQIRQIVGSSQVCSGRLNAIRLGA